jgi:hypothetical protein
MTRTNLGWICVLAAVCGLATQGNGEVYRSAITEGPVVVGDGSQAVGPDWTDTFHLDTVDGDGVLSLECRGAGWPGGQVWVNGVLIGNLLWPQPEYIRHELPVAASVLQAGENTFRIAPPPDHGSGLDDIRFRNVALMDVAGVYGPRYPVIIEKDEVHLGDNPPPHDWSDTFQLDSVQTPVALSIETIGVGNPGCLIKINGHLLGEVPWATGSDYARHELPIDPNSLQLGENTFWITAAPDGVGGWDDMNFRNAMVVPEPATLSVLAIGGLAALIRRRRR